MTRQGGLARVGKEVGCLWPALGLAVGGSAVVIVLGLGAGLRSVQAPAEPAAPLVTRISRPTSTATPEPTAVQPTVTPEPIAAPGTIKAGDLVEVFGTNGDGVRLRSSPSLQGDVNGLGMDSDVFQVQDGPVEAAGHTWWFLVNPYDTTQQGWAVVDYLRPLQAP